MQNISSRELHKQIQMHLESLRLSGVEWLENNNNSTLQISEGLAHKSPPVDGEAAVTNLPLPEKSSTHSVLHSLEKKTGLLQLLKEEVANCVKCPQLVQTRKNTVFGVGKIEPDICFVEFNIKSNISLLNIIQLPRTKLVPKYLVSFIPEG